MSSDDESPPIIATRRQRDPNGNWISGKPQIIPTHRITKEQFGLAPAIGEDNDEYARRYNTD